MAAQLSRRDFLSMGTTAMLTAGFAPGVAASRGGSALAKQIQNAFAALDPDPLIQLAVELCNVPSLFGHEEAAARFLCDRMQEEGLTASLQSIAPGRSNVVGMHKGSGDGRSLMFNGHLDVTPFRRYFTPFKDWRSVSFTESGAVPAAHIEGEWICGMGIRNMKGALAAYVAAVRAVRKAGIRLAGDVLIAGVAGGYDQSAVDDTRINGENLQGFSVGTKHLLTQGVVADMAVVGEPTSFELVRETFGTMAVRIDVPRAVVPGGIKIFDDLQRSVSAVAPAEPRPLNAVEYAAEIVQALRAWIPEYQKRNTVGEAVPPVTISALEGGVPWACEPEESSVFVFFATPPGAPPEPVLEEMRSVLATVQTKYLGHHTKVALYSVNAGPSVPNESPIVTALQAAHAEVFGQAPETAIPGWHSAASPLVLAGIPAVTYGLRGKIAVEFDKTGKVSRETESVRIRDLVDLTRVYIALIVRICGASNR